MSKEIVPRRYSISIVVLFMLGSSLFIGVTGKSGNSNWVAILIAIAFAVPLMFMYARLHTLFPGLDLFDMLIAFYGKLAGKIISCLYIWYALHLGSLVLRNFGEFTRTVALTETPMIVPLLFIGMLCTSVVRAGLEVLGRTANFLLIFSLIVIIIVGFLSVPGFHYHHLLPLLDPGWTPIFGDALGVFTFPFAEIVLFLGAYHSISDKESAYKILLPGLLIAGTVILIISLRNLLVLGPNILTGLYFPSYVAVSRINIGNFLTRIEGSSAIIFVTALLIKVSICLYVTSNGIAKVFNFKSYRSVVFQMALIMVYLSIFIFKDIFEMEHFAIVTYKYYALPFQVVIPVILWVTAEWINRKGNKKQLSSQS